VISTNAALEFRQIDGWEAPTNRNVQVSAGAKSIINGFYTVLPPSLVVDGTQGIGITGTTGTTYRIEFRTNLSSGQWLPLKTNTLGPGFNLLVPTNGTPGFYRAVWLP
jgi:hypothetical protein